MRYFWRVHDSLYCSDEGDVTMGNWIPSVGRKRTPNGVSATSSATKNGKISTAENDEATTAGSTTTAGEVGDQQQSPHLNIYRSLSNIDEVTYRVLFVGLLVRSVDDLFIRFIFIHRKR